MSERESNNGKTPQSLKSSDSALPRLPRKQNEQVKTYGRPLSHDTDGQ
jgi:hypothetical protein